MKIAFFDAKKYDEESFTKNNKKHDITFFKENLSLDTIHLANGFDAVCCFVNTMGDKEILEELVNINIFVWLQRSMGYNKIDLNAANKLGVKVFRVPDYSSESISEHAMYLLLSVSRGVVKAGRKIAKYDFSLDGLIGKNIFGSTVGIIGAGKIGQNFIKAVKGMGVNVVVYDKFKEKEQPFLTDILGFRFVSLDELLLTSDFISLHAPLMPATKHIINKDSIEKMKDGVVLINTSRGPLIDTTALIEGLDSGKISGAGLDVLERESGRFFFDRSTDSHEIINEDKEWEALMAKDNVLITAHQAFFTEIALRQIAQITLANADDAEKHNFINCLQLQKSGKVING